MSYDCLAVGYFSEEVSVIGGRVQTDPSAESEEESEVGKHGNHQHTVDIPAHCRHSVLTISMGICVFLVRG